MQKLKQKLKQVFSIILNFMKMMYWLTSTLGAWFIQAVPKTKKDISYFLNLVVANYIIYTMFFLPAVIAMEILPSREMSIVTNETVVEKIVIKEINNKDAWVANRIAEAGLKPLEAMMVNINESGYSNNENKWGVNTNGSIDMGRWQINSIHYNKPWANWKTKEVSTLTLSCVVDYKCSTDWAISKRLNDGNWSAWSGAKKAGLR